MTDKEANKIIKEYKVHEGFFDLSKQPKTLNKLEYAKVLKLQNFLVEQNKNREYLQKFNKPQWEKLKEISAQLQGVILQQWGDIILN
ncbi:hypothetical protein FDC45_17815 [Clostridium botulinum]|uniref:Uncharacterized protein n=1 Tax=Clostridium botulinum TaxID=1491 RepID=A0A846JI50_CLOBO|nr:hypothetical protein [Clostridium botulinum]ACA57397.1 hypothetical protein CLK_A0251 [Clostridium botulinum A3 str. Loch Maree]NFH67026.1 hypothetical protein [Clostridium botulinum]NFJ09615.1 hypothetical protein [Clostridium botulinum]NFK16584.1 hypothetical protein [Clostridium botulinum]NFM94309.1 hypothetical protein [Clostridium botulinum]